MPVNQQMYQLGAKRNIMREIFEHGKRRAAIVGPENVLDFSLGNPSVAPPEQVNQSIRAILDGPEAASIHAYTSAQGDGTVREALSASLNRRFAAGCGPEHLYITVGAAAALCSCLYGLSCPGDEFIVVVPYFTEYRVFIESAGAAVVEVPAKAETFDLDLEALERAITHHTKGIIINSPNNPSGVVYPAETLAALGELLRRKRTELGQPIYLISDEPYREIVYGAPAPWVPNFYENTLVCYSYSKSLSLPGERIGYVLVPPAVEEWQTVYAAIGGAGRSLGYVNAPSLFQRVAATCDGLTADLSVYERNRNLLYEGLTGMGYTCVKPEGTFYLMMKAPEPDAEAFCRRAMERDLLLAPTDTYGLPGYVRIAFCVDTATVEKALPVFAALAAEYGR